MDLFHWMLRHVGTSCPLIVILPAQKVAKWWIKTFGSGNEGV